MQRTLQARVAASPDFNYVRQDIAYYKKKVQDPTVSLNQDARIKELADQKALVAQRKKDLEARQGSRDKVLDLTLDMVEANLPPAPPVDKKPKVDVSSDASSDGTDDLSVQGKSPKDDPQLDEAVNIMADYTKMLRDSGSKLVQTTPAAAK